MTRRLGTSLIVLLAVAAAALAATAAGRQGGAHVRVHPKIGSPSTFFVVSFRAPQSTGRIGAAVRQYVVEANQAGASIGCVSSISRTVSKARKHERVHVTLAPSTRWCTGKFHGQVQETQGPVCVTGKACPQFVTVLKKIGKFSFRVKLAPGGDTTPPKFAGLKSAVACTPGPQRPGQTTPYTLTWDAASDNVTPQKKIVYDIYESSTPGGEDFSQPAWTTSPGATTFKTPGLPAHGGVYFVVRARDEAGNEDHNRVERPGVDPCV